MNFKFILKAISVAFVSFTVILKSSLMLISLILNTEVILFCKDIPDLHSFAMSMISM